MILEGPHSAFDFKIDKSLININLGTQTSASNSGGYLSSAGLQRPNQYNFDNTGTIAVSGRVNSDETRVVNVGIYYYIKT